MLNGIVHLPSPKIQQCELTHVSQTPIDVSKAANQHRSYCEMLLKLGAHLTILDDNIHLPDCAFVEDTAVVLDENAVILSMGAEARREETSLVAQALAPFRQLVRIHPPASIDGGDVLRIGKKLYVGRSTRTNAAGIQALSEAVEPFGYQAVDVRVSGCLHLKSGCTALDDKTILINPDWVDEQPFSDFERVRVSNDEPFAGNILRINDAICIHSGFQNTMRALESKGYEVVSTNISEFLKAEAGMTCLSIIFERET